MPEDIPQSVVAAFASGSMYVRVPGWTRQGLAAALREYERLGYRLVRDDEATVERIAKALWVEDQHDLTDWCNPEDEHEANFRRAARAALTAAQGGEDRG